jgi:hypothetical protein
MMLSDVSNDTKMSVAEKRTEARKANVRWSTQGRRTQQANKAGEAQTEDERQKYHKITTRQKMAPLSTQHNTV